jgi:hypothetical protein
LLKNQLCPEYYPFEIVKTKECVESCEIDEFINKLCIINSFSKNNINNITDRFKTIINDVDNSDFDVIIEGNNIIYEITTTSVKNEHSNISLIDFGECEKILKSRYSIEYLLVFKVDIKINDSYPLAVEYEVYSPENKTKLDISLCENKNIDIYVPISMDNQANSLYDSMSQYGIDILNANNSFYNDICIPFTTDDGTDITLSDRQNAYYNEDITLCEEDCEYISYNSTSRKIKCKCKIKTKITDITVISYEKINAETFLDIKRITNLDIMKCIKLTFSLNGLSNNYGNIIISIFLLFHISLIIIYLLTKKKAVSRIIRIAFKKNNFENNPPRKSINKFITHHSSNINKKIINSSNSKQQSQTQSIRELIDTNNISINKKNSKNLKINNFQNINVIQKANIILDYDRNLTLFDKKQKKHKKHKKHKKKRKSPLKGVNVYNINKTVNRKKRKKESIIDNEQELNSLPMKRFY